MSRIVEELSGLVIIEDKNNGGCAECMLYRAYGRLSEPCKLGLHDTTCSMGLPNRTEGVCCHAVPIKELKDV